VGQGIPLAGANGASPDLGCVRPENASPQSIRSTSEDAYADSKLSVVRKEIVCFHCSEVGPNPAPGSARGPALDQHQVFDEGF